jgi:hypothetical protein
MLDSPVVDVPQPTRTYAGISDLVFQLLDAQWQLLQGRKRSMFGKPAAMLQDFQDRRSLVAKNRSMSTQNLCLGSSSFPWGKSVEGKKVRRIPAVHIGFRGKVELSGERQ